MKQIKRLAFVWMLSLASFQYTEAQNVPTKVSLDLPAVSGASMRQSRSIELPLPGSKKLSGKINYNQSRSAGKQNIAGNIEGVSAATFYLRADGSAVEGNIVLKESKTAYRYFSDNKGTFVEQVDIESVLCIEYESAPGKTSPSSSPSFLPVSPAALKLQSLPGAPACVLLDFDGQYVSGTPWNGGAPINALPAGFTEAEIRETYELVKEDFLPFNLNITTDSNVFLTYPQDSRMRAIITPTSDAAPGWGGVAYIGSFKWNDDTPCWVFNLGAKNAGETVSHEIGHTLGLLHDGRDGHSGSAHEEYFGGHGDWAPIMGASFWPAVTQWSKGEYQYANLQEDDLAIIASYRNGFGYRSDDHGDAISTATPLRKDASGNVFLEQNYGIIGKRGDKDYFSFTTTSAGNILLYLQPAARHGNLNIRATLYDAAGVVKSFSDNTGVTSFINSGGPAGTYYMMVEAVGEGIALTNGYTDYASLGFYSISGNVSGSASDITPVTVYRDCNYTGTPATWPLFVGNFSRYRLQEFSIQDDDIASLKVKPGYKIELYDYDYFNGPTVSFTADDNCLTDNNFYKKTGSLRVMPTGNRLPEVTLTYPLNNAVIYTPATLVLKAAPSDEDGTIAKVEFYNGATKLGEATAAPYQYTWSSVSAGTYALKAVVTDNSGGVTSSYTNNVTVTAYSAKATFYPNCSYGGTAVGLAPGTYSLAALNAKGIANDDIASVQVSSGYEVILYKGDYTYEEAKKITANTSCLSASGFENAVSSLIVRPVTANKAPDVTIMGPTNGADLTGTAGLAFSINTNDVDGYVTHVEIYSGSTLIGTGTYPGYYVYWAPTVGTHVITAKAFDNDNAFTVSQAVTVTKSGSTCTATPWASNVAYVNGNQVEHSGIKYQANWWNYNQPPHLNNGPVGSGKPWTSLGACTSRTAGAEEDATNASDQSSLLVYPNPSNGSFTIESDSDVSAQVLNSYGQEVAKVSLVKGKNDIKLSLTNGIYLVKVDHTVIKMVVE